MGSIGVGGGQRITTGEFDDFFIVVTLQPYQPLPIEGSSHWRVPLSPLPGGHPTRPCAFIFANNQRDANKLTDKVQRTGRPSAAIVTLIVRGHITIWPACHAKGLLRGEIQMDNRRGHEAAAQQEAA